MTMICLTPATLLLICCLGKRIKRTRPQRVALITTRHGDPQMNSN